MGTPGVERVEGVRVRPAGPSLFVDMVVDVARSASLEEAHQVALEVDRRVTQLIERGDVVVHVDPARRANENLPQTVSALAARLGLRTHDVHAHRLREDYYVDLHVEVPEDWSLAQAHEQVSRLEEDIRQELSHVREIYSHIEPFSAPVALAEGLSAAREKNLRAQIEALLAETELCEIHELKIHPANGGYDVVFHCLADPDLSVGQAHHQADRAEQVLRANLPEISRVLVHMEPREQEA
jgi:divalent metal cation (Fe/Co/Zn/Cd) transporter